MNQVATADIDSNQDSPPKHGTIGDSSLQFLYQNHDTNVFFFHLGIDPELPDHEHCSNQ